MLLMHKGYNVVQGLHQQPNQSNVQILYSLDRNVEINYEIPSTGNEGIYIFITRRRLQATKRKNEKGRGCNKMKVLKNPVIYICRCQ